ncbi:hypothetical protein [Pantoea sp. 1.19]|uniref:hypothetical protein n=1 Tax=Pantoea sp. 1.19 TaxID=1925589 RepID=UPI00147D6413|nr:hypothetical protein [Pantoea sp. 1.19]
MDNHNDKMVAIIGLLSAALIAVTLLFSLTWYNTRHHDGAEPVILSSCASADRPASVP